MVSTSYTFDRVRRLSRTDFYVPILGIRLKELRESKGYNLQDMAELLDISYQAYSKWEQGGNPTVDKLRLLCDVLSCSADYLLGLVDKPFDHVELDKLPPDEQNLIRMYRAGNIPRHVKRLLGDLEFLEDQKDRPAIEGPGQGSTSSEEKTA